MVLTLDQLRAAADVLLRQNDDAARAVGVAMARWIEGGGQRAAWAALVPAGKPGMSRERREAKARAEKMLPILRRRFWPDKTGQDAAAEMRMALLQAKRLVEREKETFAIAEADTNSLHYWCLEFVRSGALTKSGNIVETETLRKKMVRQK